MAGVQIGLRDIHFAELIEDTKEAIEYETPERIIGAIQATITPTVNAETLFADDGPSEVASALGDIEVALNVKDLPLPVQAKLLGHRFENGVILRSADDIAPYVALGFRSQKSNGKDRFVWLYKGKFSVPEQDYTTKEDTPAFQTPTINGTFVKREHDNLWQVIGDEDEQDFLAGPTWFDSVFSEQETPGGGE